MSNLKLAVAVRENLDSGNRAPDAEIYDAEKIDLVIHGHQSQFPGFWNEGWNFDKMVKKFSAMIRKAATAQEVGAERILQEFAVCG